jgi:hypothetical protein
MDTLYERRGKRTMDKKDLDRWEIVAIVIYVLIYVLSEYLRGRKGRI